MSIFTLAISYLVGAIPSGYWFAKYLFGVDVTKHGSRNIGATNVARVLGNKKYFFLIFAFDFSKAFFLLKFLASTDPHSATFSAPLYCAALLLIGNCYSIFLRFKGGKGVATSLGILAAIFPPLFFVALVSFATVLFFSKRVAYASVAGISATIPAYFIFCPAMGIHPFLFLVFLVMLVIWRHVSVVFL